MTTAYRKHFANVNRGGVSFGPLARTLLLFLWLCACAAAAADSGGFEHGLLWRVEGADSAPSYLFGTMHSDDPAVVQLAAPVQKVFDQSEALVLEVTLDPQSLLSLTAALLLSDGKTLPSLLGQELFQRAVEALASHRIPEALVANMKPWAVAVTLMTPPAREGLVLDHRLYQRAVADGKPVDGLETVAEQVALFDDLTLEQQILLVKDTLDNLPAIESMLGELREAWIQRDLARLLEINEAALQDGDPELAAAFNQRIVVDRNHLMAQRMESRLREGGRFIAVGALHLPGPEGLLRLLQQRGYRLTRIY